MWQGWKLESCYHPTPEITQMWVAENMEGMRQKKEKRVKGRNKGLKKTGIEKDNLSWSDLAISMATSPEDDLALHLELSLSHPLTLQERDCTRMLGQSAGSSKSIYLLPPAAQISLSPACRYVLHPDSSGLCQSLGWDQLHQKKLRSLKIFVHTTFCRLGFEVEDGSHEQNTCQFPNLPFQIFYCLHRRI